MILVFVQQYCTPVTPVRPSLACMYIVKFLEHSDQIKGKFSNILVQKNLFRVFLSKDHLILFGFSGLCLIILYLAISSLYLSILIPGFSNLIRHMQILNIEKSHHETGLLPPCRRPPLPNPKTCLKTHSTVWVVRGLYLTYKRRNF